MQQTRLLRICRLPGAAAQPRCASQAPTVLYLLAMRLMLTAVRPHALTPGSFAISITMILITGGEWASSGQYHGLSTIR